VFLNLFNDYPSWATQVQAPAPARVLRTVIQTRSTKVTKKNAKEQKKQRKEERRLRKEQRKEEHRLRKEERKAMKYGQSDGPSGAYAPLAVPAQHFAPPPYPPVPGAPVSFPTPNHSTLDKGQGQACGSFPAPSKKEYGSVSGYPANQPFVPYGQGQGQLKESPSMPSSDVKGQDPGPQQFKPPPGPPPGYTPSPQARRENI